MSKSRNALIYSCSGCSSAAQMANSLAVKADRTGVAEMSCIAGVGGDVMPLVKVAKSGRDIVVLDGCPLECARNCLARHGIKPNLHLNLADFGVKKVQHGDFIPSQADELFSKLKTLILDMTSEGEPAN